MCLTVEYVEGHDPNPSCFVMFRSIATGYELSVAINGTSMCVHLSPQVYTIVATDTEDEINTTAPAPADLHVSATCEKMIYSMRGELVDANHFYLYLVTQAGTYIKELCTGTLDVLYLTCVNCWHKMWIY